MTFGERARYLLKGMGMVLQICPEQVQVLSEYSGPLSFDEYTRRVWEADCEALAGDWKKVGGDIEQAIKKVEGLK